jgi:hypothetical protein
MSGVLRLQVLEDGADDELLAAMAGFLRAELLQLDVGDVCVLREGEPPPGARASSAAAIGGLLVTLGQSADALHSVVSVTRDWLRRGGGSRRMVRLELAGDALELSQATVADQERLVRLFVSQHATGEKGQWAASGRH